MLAIKQLTVPIDFHCISFPTVEVNGDQQLFGSSKSFKIYFVFNIRKKLVQVWNKNMYIMTKMFWVNYSFKMLY